MLRTMLKLSCLFVLVSIIVPAHAALPYTFANGQTADASQLNADLQTLQNEINQLQAQLAALQPQAASTAILGTWTIVSVNSFTQANGSTTATFGNVGGSGTVTFNANGTFATNQPMTEYAVIVGVGTLAMDGSVVGTTPSPGSALQSGSYTLSGSTVTLNFSGGGTATGTLSGDGHVLVFATLNNGGNGHGLTIGVKQ